MRRGAEVWTAFFNIKRDETLRLLKEFLGEVSIPYDVSVAIVEGAYSRHAKHLLVVRAKTKDDAFRCGEFIRHNFRRRSGIPLFYSVAGRDGRGRLIYASWCRLCRAGKHRHGLEG